MEANEKEKRVDSQPEVETAEDIQANVDEVMKKYDRESNTRIWTGTPGLVIKMVSVVFSIICIIVHFRI